MAKIIAHTAKLLCLPLLAALFQGCHSTVDGATLAGSGFASDTTAILFYNLHETAIGSFSHRSSTDYYGWELRLVDVRFNKVYWKAQINHGSSQILRAVQCNDSTMFIELAGKDYWLWTVGNKTPRKVDFKWNTEKKIDLLYHYKWLKWKNNSFLLFSDSPLIIDTRAMTISSWNPTSTEEELLKKDAVWDGEQLIYLETECKQEDLLSCCYTSYTGRLCKCPETLEPCKAFVISSGGYTLHTVGHYPYIERQETFTSSGIFDKRCKFTLSYDGKYISIEALNLDDYYYGFALPAALLPENSSNIPNVNSIKAIIFIDKNKKELLNPSAWRFGENFVDSFGNVTRY
jgi:hypothetical protein